MDYKKVIFSGGFASKAEDGGAAFCNEIIEDGPSRIRILECIFGMSADLGLGAMEKDIALFKKKLPKAELEFEMARKDVFAEQIRKADVIHFRGGNTDLLYEALSQIEGWQSVLKNKILVGASAGAYILSDFYIKRTGIIPSLEKGFGLISAKTVAHYRSGYAFKDNPEDFEPYWDRVDQLMATTREDLLSVKLREGEYKVL